MKIYRASLSDVDDVSNLFALYRVFYGKEYDIEGAKSFLRERLKNEESIIFVASLNGKCIGFTQLYPTFSSVSMARVLILNDLYVNRDFRGKGIGESLIMEAKRYAQSIQAKYIQLSTGIENKTAQSLYERLGFLQENSYFTYVLDS